MESFSIRYGDLAISSILFARPIQYSLLELVPCSALECRGLVICLRTFRSRVFCCIHATAQGPTNPCGLLHPGLDNTDHNPTSQPLRNSHTHTHHTRPLDSSQLRQLGQRPIAPCRRRVRIVYRLLLTLCSLIEKSPTKNTLRGKKSDIKYID